MKKNANSFRDKGVKGDPALLQSVQRRTPSAAGDCETHHVPGGTIITPARARRVSTPSADCPFGKIITIPAEGETPAGKGISGGAVSAGPQTWHMEPQALNLEAVGEWLVWLVVGVTAQNYEGVPYPGLTSSTEPVWDKGSVEDGYPDMTFPTSAEPEGTAIVPLGKLTIEDGSAKFEPVACGGVIIEHCTNNLSIKRGNAPDPP